MDFISVLIFRYLCEANTSKQREEEHNPEDFKAVATSTMRYIWIFCFSLYVERMGEGIANFETKNEHLRYNS